MGMDRAILPSSNAKGLQTDLELAPVRTLSDALVQLF